MRDREPCLLPALLDAAPPASATCRDCAPRSIAGWPGPAGAGTTSTRSGFAVLFLISYGMMESWMEFDRFQQHADGPQHEHHRRFFCTPMAMLQQCSRSMVCIPFFSPLRLHWLLFIAPRQPQPYFCGLNFSTHHPYGK